MSTMSGRDIYLREIRLSDVGPGYVAWLNDPEVNQYLETRFEVQTTETIEKFVGRVLASGDEHLFAICLTVGDRHIGNIKLGPINFRHRTADLSLFIGEKSEWSKGYAREAILLLTSHAFREKNLNKVRAGCYSANIGSARAFEACGFVREGLLRAQALVDGQSMDVITLGLTAAEFFADSGAAAGVPDVGPRVPIFNACSLSEAHSISPWPARLSGEDNWKKTERSVADVLLEYEESWYRPLLKSWLEYRGAIARRPRPQDVLNFYKLIDRQISRDIENNPSVYRSTVSDYLISSGDRLLRGDLNAAMAVHEWLIDSILGELFETSRCTSVVELGCGNGKHLFRSYSKLGVDEARGGDLCPSAILLGSQLAGDADMNLKFELFNFYDRSYYASITAGLERYVVYTQHAIEQLPQVEGSLIDSILSLGNRPEYVVHFEPVDFAPDRGFADLCRQYAAINKYNSDLWSALLAAQRRGDLEIVQVRKRVWGISAFNPTSVIVWKPLVAGCRNDRPTERAAKTL